jgi:hypothetical protein
VAIELRGEAGTGGWRFRVRAAPGATRPGVRGEHDGALRLAVAAPPEKGRANAELVERLAEALGVRRAQLELVAGATGREKWVAVRGLGEAALRERLAVLVAAARKP